jgi:ABC-type glycerol-3-phosphate transport system permease component
MSDILPVHHRPLRVRKVHSLRTFIWLAKGARDFARAPLVGLSHGLVMAGSTLAFLPPFLLYVALQKVHYIIVNR